MADIQFSDMQNKAPLLSDRFIKRLTFWVCLLVVATVALNFLGIIYSKRISQGTHTSSTQPIDVFIGPDHLQLPANAIRFPDQRITGEMESVNLYLLWPTLEGFSEEKRAQFNSVKATQKLIFVQLSQATMTLDMSGRIKPIYSHLLEKTAKPGPAGLTMYRFKPGTGYGDEVMLVGKTNSQTPFAIRCIMPAKSADVTGVDCQRDIAMGSDLSVQYRYPSTMLTQWRELDDAIRNYVEAHLVVPASARTGRISP